MAMPEVEVPQGNIKKLSQKAVKRIDADVDGDVDTSDPKSSEMGEFVPDPTGKKKIKTKVQKESLSDWRGDLREVMTDTKDLKKVKEKKVKNKITINPKLGEAVEKIGGHLLEVKKVDGKIDIKKSDMGDVIKDFYKSDAPQFKGKTKEKRREMAIAAKLSTEQAGQDQNQEDPKVKSAEKKENQIKKRVLMQKLRAVRNNVQGIIAHNELDGEMVEGIMTMIGRKKKEKKAEKAMDAGARAKRKLARKAHAKYVSGSEDNVPDDIREEKKKGLDGKACWKGYKLAGTKKKGGKTVDNCVKVDEAKVDAGKSPEQKEKDRNVRKFGVSHNVAGHGKLRRALHRSDRGDKKIKGDKSQYVEMESVVNEASRGEKEVDASNLKKVGRRNINRFETGTVKRTESSGGRKPTYKTVTLANPKPGYGKKSDHYKKNKLSAPSLGRHGTSSETEKGPQKHHTQGVEYHDAAQKQRRQEHKSRRGVKTKGTVASDIKKSLKEEDKAYQYVVSKLKKKYGDGVLTKGDKIKPKTAAQKKAAAAHQAKVDRENAAERAKDPSQGRYPPGYSNRGSD